MADQPEILAYFQARRCNGEPYFENHTTAPRSRGGSRNCVLASVWAATYDAFSAHEWQHVHSCAQTGRGCDTDPGLRRGRRLRACPEAGEVGEEDVARALDTCGVRYDVTRRGDPEFGMILDGIEKCGLLGWADSVEVSARSLQITALRAIREANGSRNVIELCVRLTRENKLASLLLKAYAQQLIPRH